MSPDLLIMFPRSYLPNPEGLWGKHIPVIMRQVALVRSAVRTTCLSIGVRVAKGDPPLSETLTMYNM